MIQEANTVSIAKVLKLFKINVKEGETYKIQCPFSERHKNRDTSRSAKIFANTNSIFCFTEVKSWDTVGLVAEKLNLSQHDAAKWVADRFLKSVSLQSRFISATKRVLENERRGEVDLSFSYEMALFCEKARGILRKLNCVGNISIVYIDYIIEEFDQESIRTIVEYRKWKEWARCIIKSGIREQLLFNKSIKEERIC